MYVHVLHKSSPIFLVTHTIGKKAGVKESLLHAGHKLCGEQLCLEADVDECVYDLQVLWGVLVSVDCYRH